ncbi:transporter substrate-binding domain-containing protein, partial [Rhizobium ruizarguesonis]
MPSQSVLTKVHSTYPPFEFVDASGTIQGFDIDITKALCAEMKAE